jgi:hypothetical protein
MPISFFLFVACKLSGNVSLLEIEELWNRTKEKEEEKKKKKKNDWRESTEQKSIVCSVSVSVYREEEEGEKRETKEKIIAMQLQLLL